MKKLFLGTSLLAMMSLIPLSTMAEVNINIGIPIPRPPHIEFSAPPRLVVVPETYVYVAPDVEEEIFFSDGWWYRPWEGRWYRSRNYNSGWQHYRSTPSFYSHVPHDWRTDYREGRWRGQQWNVQPIPHTQVERNWKGWKTNNHWEKNKTWGVENLQRQRAPQHPPERGRGNHSNRSNDRDKNQR